MGWVGQGGFFGPSASYSMPHATQQAQAMYVNYQQPNPIHVQAKTNIKLTGPAVMWAANGQNGQQRDARLYNDTMLLSDPSGLLLVNTHLPLTGKRVHVSGKLIGVVGKTAVSMHSNYLYLTNMTAGTSNSVHLQDLANSNEVPWFDALIDGPFVFVSGPRGIWCINALSSERLFAATLKSAKELEDVSNLTPQEQQLRQQRLQNFSSVVTFTNIGKVHEQTIYTLQDRHELVAIEHKTQ